MERCVCTLRPFLALALAALVSGCSSGTLVPSSPSGAVSAVSAGSPGAARATGRHHKASVKFEIRIPKRHRRRHYVSPYTAAIKIVANGVTLGTYNTTPASPGCSTIDAATQCSFTIGVPSGNVTFSISTLSATSAVLSQGSVTQTIATGTLAVIPLTLQGVVGSIAISLGNNAPAAGTATNVPVYVTAYDPSGAAIVGPGNYGTAITLTDSDSSGITSLSPATVSAPGAKVTLAYSGRSIAHATIGATATNVTNVTSATFDPTPVVFASYATAAGASSAAYAITSGPDGNLWYTTLSCGGCASHGNNAIVKMTTSGVQTVYDSVTTASLPADGVFYGITAGPDGNVWFTDNHNDTVSRITPGGVVTPYSTGALNPNRIVAGPPGDGGLWFTVTGVDAIGHVTTAGTVTTYPLTGGGTNYDGLIVGKDKNLYVVDQNTKAIGQVVISGGAVTAYSEIPIPVNPLDGVANTSLQGITQTADGQLWFTNDACSPSTVGSIAISASAFASSTVSQFVTAKGCSYPAYMTATPDGSEFFLGIWDYPVIEAGVPGAIGAAPALTDYAFQAVTPNTVFQESYDITIGPDGNVWSTIYTNDYGGSPANPANVVEMAY